MKITAKGQVTIPKHLRDRFGLAPDTEVVFEAAEDGVYIRSAGDDQAQLRRRLERSAGSATIPIGNYGAG